MQLQSRDSRTAEISSDDVAQASRWRKVEEAVALRVQLPEITLQFNPLDLEKKCPRIGRDRPTEGRAWLSAHNRVEKMRAFSATE